MAASGVKKPKPQAPSAAARQELFLERCDLILSTWMSRASYRRYCKEIRRLEERKNDVTWLTNHYTDPVFAFLRTLLQPDAYYESPLIPNSSLLTPAGLLSFLAHIPVTRGVMQVGVDNTGCVRSGTSDHLASTHIEVLSVRDPYDQRDDHTLIIGVAAGAETAWRIGLLVEAADVMGLLSMLQTPPALNVVGVGDFHAVEMWRRDIKQPCGVCGASPGDMSTFLITHSVLTRPILPLRADCAGRTGLLRLCGGDEDRASLSLLPGVWHTAGTAASHLLRATGAWAAVSAALVAANSNAVMNDSISITGCDMLLAGAAAALLPPQFSTVAMMLRARRGSEFIEGLTGLHLALLALPNTRFTAALHYGLHVGQAAEQYFGGSLTPFREKGVERAHQRIKRPLRQYNGNLSMAVPRSNWAVIRRCRDTGIDAEQSATMPEPAPWFDAHK